MKNITSINGITITAQEDLDGHVKNSAAHVTEEERTEWNAAPPVSAGGILIAPQEELDEHVNDAVVHITEEEREEWNAKTTVNARGILIATQEGLDGHASNTTVHITEEERAGWDAKPGTEEITQLEQRINELEEKGENTWMKCLVYEKGNPPAEWPERTLCLGVVYETN